MDFQKVNTLNVRLNMVSGNLLPMTADDSSFSIFWKIYSILILLLIIVHACMVVSGCIFIPKEKVLKDGLIGDYVVFMVEVVSTVMRIHTCRGLVQQLIRKLNEILRVEDEMMRSIVTETIKSMEIPFKFYWSAGMMSTILWSSPSFLLAFQRNSFFYIDYNMPLVITKEPFTTSIFVLGNVIVMLSDVFIFIKKVSMDSYIINLILLITAQYKYIALKLSMIFQDRLLHSNHSRSNTEKCYLNRDYYAEKEIKVLCRHHNIVIQIMLMLRKLLSLNISLMYVINVFRFSCIAIIIVHSLVSCQCTFERIPSKVLWEIFSIIVYAVGGIVQLYITCYCMQQLLDVSVAITNYAFHERWYQYSGNVKRIFMFMIMANSLEIKLSTFEKYNLSLSSFMAILNQSYSIALVLLRVN